jgi:hypothetical protein
MCQFHSGAVGLLSAALNSVQKVRLLNCRSAVCHRELKALTKLVKVAKCLPSDKRTSLLKESMDYNSKWFIMLALECMAYKIKIIYRIFSGLALPMKFNSAISFQHNVKKP